MYQKAEHELVYLDSSAPKRKRKQVEIYASGKSTSKVPSTATSSSITNVPVKKKATLAKETKKAKTY